MSVVVAASAPGKVVLSGEYAVLEGAPAIAMAVDRRALVEIERGSQRSSGESSGDTSLIDAVVAAHDDSSAVFCTANTEAFFDPGTGAKIGLGSSAALTAALCAALREDVNVERAALRLHRDWQGGAGSGVDVACTVRGGLIEYRMENAVVSALQWPAGLEFRLVWMGTASNTREKLQKLAAQDRSGSCTELIGQADVVARAWQSANAGAVIDAYPAYIDRLRQFSIDHDLGVFDAGHDELVDAARAESVVYKPCGAGGGDIGIALSTDSRQLDNFVATQNLYVVQCAVDPRGVSLEPKQRE